MHLFASGRATRPCASSARAQPLVVAPVPRTATAAAPTARRRRQPPPPPSAAAAAGPSPASAASASSLKSTPRPSIAAAAAPGPSSAPASSSRSASPSAGPPTAYTATLLVQCPDQKGVIAALATLLAGYNCNVLASDQFTDVDSYREDGTVSSGKNGNGNGSSSDGGSSNAPRFFQRIHFDFTDLSVGISNLDVLEKAISGVAERYDMQFRLAVNSGRDPRQAGANGASSSTAPTLLKKKCVILVSKLDHCLYDLLIRAKNGELPMEVPVVASNHPDLEHVARMFGVDFEHVPITASATAAASERAAAKKAHEARLTSIIDEAGADLVVLARYMQIMSSEFCEANWRRTVNIHHSFLPAFEGARPYHRAHARGVKLIGATAHYATADLDCGPILCQDVAAITHRDTVADMVRKGRDLERIVLARAVRAHVLDRVIVHKNKTVVFEE